MVRISILYSLFILILYSCGSVHGQTQESKTSYPTCIQKKIDTIKQQPLANPPITIYQATYKGKFVYHITAPCCDIYSTLVDENCKTICHPSGGITGNGDLKCGDIQEKMTASKLIWKDQRKSNKK